MLIPAEPEPIEICIAQTAVVIVDMQNAFVSRGGLFDIIGNDISNIQTIIVNCRRILPLSREKGIKIVYLQMEYDSALTSGKNDDRPELFKSPSLKFLKEHPKLKDKLPVAGSWGTEIIDELKPHPGDIIVKKQKYDGFTGTELDNILKGLGIKFLLFMGTAANICVESTLRHAFFLNYFPVIISDAVGHAGPGSLKEATILNIKSYFGWVTTTEKFLKAII